MTTNTRRTSRSNSQHSLTLAKTNTEVHNNKHLELHYLCEVAKDSDDGRGWERVRNWFLSHTISESENAITQISSGHSGGGSSGSGRSISSSGAAATAVAVAGTTAIHMACKNSAPLDIIEMFLNACEDSLEFRDSHGWCPLHYACHYGVASEDVLKVLILSCPKMLREQDSKGRVPLHFAANSTAASSTSTAATTNNKHRSFTPSIFTMLTQSGAAMKSDAKGMLPIHYSCAYGTSNELLEILIDAYPASVQHKDHNGFTPLHYAMGNCERDESPATIELLLSKLSNYVDHSTIIVSEQQHQSQQQQHHQSQQQQQQQQPQQQEQKDPLLVFADRTRKFKDVSKRECENAKQSLQNYLRKKPLATMNFFTALQSLPPWLEDIAVVDPYVQGLLNEKISKKFPTAIMMLDFYAIVATLAAYIFAVINSIDRRSDDENDNYSDSDSDDPIPMSLLLPLYIVGAYFTVREFVQILSFIHLGLFFSSWFKRGTNWIEISFIVQVIFWTVVMETGAMSLNFFQTGTTITLFFLWLNFLNFLRGMIVEFAVFVSGVVHVLKRLGVFLMALLIILVAFMQIFYTLFLASGYCEGFEVDRSHADICDPEEGGEPYRFCTNWDSFLSVYTMLLGEVDEGDFETSVVATIAFIVFVFLVVILLANVLIAIVTDSYSVIKNERAAIVFWSNRLDFIVEMNVISNGPVMRRVKRVFFGSNARSSTYSSQDNKNDLVSNVWVYIVELFEEDGPYLSVEVWSMAFVCLNFLRFIAILIVIPLWFVLGLCTVGLFWPPQIRQKVMRQRISKKRSAAVVKTEHQKHEIRNLKNSVASVRNELTTSLAKQKEEIEEIRTEMADLHSDVVSEFRSVKETLDALFELHNFRG